ncbi:hypothetical protein D3C75_1187690 [compost metagenome]
MAQVPDFIFSADRHTGFVIHMGQLAGNPNHLVKRTGQPIRNPEADSPGDQEQKAQPQEQEQPQLVDGILHIP